MSRWWRRPRQHSKMGKLAHADVRAAMCRGPWLLTSPLVDSPTPPAGAVSIWTPEEIDKVLPTAG